jgi:hypothetical protein
METAIVIHGVVVEKHFISDEPMPDVEGAAELIIYPRKDVLGEKTARVSMFDLFGKAEHLRSGEDIDAQIREAWGDR